MHSHEYAWCMFIDRYEYACLDEFSLIDAITCLLGSFYACVSASIKCLYAYALDMIWWHDVRWMLSWYEMPW